MDHNTLQLLNEVNRSIIKFRGLYAQWSGEHGISYHEMLVLYTIREKGFCTQKQICDSYIIPRQTMHNVIGGLRREGILAVSEADSVGREKAFVLTKKGEGYAAPLLEALERMESRAVELLGWDRLEQLTALMTDYDRALQGALAEMG